MRSPAGNLSNLASMSVRSSHFSPVSRFGTCLLAAGILAACEGQGLPTAGIALKASPEVVAVPLTQTSASFFLTTEPAGRLDWRISAKPDWVQVEPMEGVVKGNVVEVRVTLGDLGGLAPGVQRGKIEIVSNGGVAQVAIQAEVSAAPVAAVSPGALSVSESASGASFVLRNTGNAVLTWSASRSHPWMTINTPSGQVYPRDSVVVSTSVNRTGLPAGTTSGSITIRSNAKSGDVILPVTVAVPAQPIATVSRSRLKFPDGVASTTFALRNTGNSRLLWSITRSDAWLSTSATAGELAPGDSVVVTSSVNRTGLQGETASGSLTVKSNSTGGEIVIPVDVALTSSAGRGLWVLDHRVVDTEYSKAADLIVTVAASPARLYILDPDLRTSRSVNLPLTPTAVSIRPDGAFAAVGHDGYISYVNLATRSVVRTYAVTTDVLDVVLAANGYVYAFPRRDQWTSIRSINLQTGQETLSPYPSIYAGTVAKLHPSGNYMYGANNGLSPSDFEKYDIRSGTARILYDSPYHGDYAFSGDLWISEDGSRLFARSGNVFRSSPVQAEDMRYAGKLAGVGGVRWVDDSRVTGRIYVVPGQVYPNPAPAPEIRVYDATFLAFQGSVPLPKFSGANGTQYDAEGRFVFVNSTGARFYALIQASGSSGLGLDWAVASFERSTTP